MKHLPAIVVLLAAALVATSCSDESSSGIENKPRPTPIDGAIVFSPEWRGEWNTVIEFRECGTGDLVAIEDVVDVICGEDTLQLDISPILGDCDGLIDGERLDVACSYGYGVDANCGVTMEFFLNLDVDGDVVTGTGVWTVQALGDCSVDYPGGCEQIVVTATRLDPNPDSCDSSNLRSLHRLRSISRVKGGAR
jgi:hypothetical protein